MTAPFSKTYQSLSDKFIDSGHSEFQVNLGLFNNQEIVNLANQSMNLKSDIQTHIKNMGDRNITKQQLSRERKLNRMIINYSNVLTELVDKTSAHMLRGLTVQDAQVVKKLLELNKKPTNQVNVWEYITLGKQYYDLLVVNNIVPIVASYTETSGISKLMSE
jgi:hypothetical protein